MQYSIINYKKLQKGIRIDAEYYKPEFLKLEHQISKKKYSNLRIFLNFCKKGIFDINPDYYNEQGIPLIRTTEIKDPLTDFSTNVFLDEEVNEIYKNTELKPGDIVFTKIGASIGDVAILPTKFSKYNFSQNVVGASIKQNQIETGFLLAYLLSKFGKEQILRIAMISGQGKLELNDIKNLKVINLSSSIRKNIQNIISKAYFYKENSLKLYSQAEKILLSELGLLDWNPKHELSFIKNFYDTQKANRIDAEYFQPKYDEIIESVKKYKGGFDTVKGQFKLNKKSFKKDNNKQYRYIEIGCINISDGSMEPIVLQGLELPANAKINIQKGDVVVSKVRPYRGAIGIVYRDGYIGSGAFTVLQENGVIKKETLMIFLRLRPLLDLSLKYNTGTSYPTITDDDILDLPLPKIDIGIQDQIKEKITEMYSAKKLSKSLLEIAKKGVEIAIERDEKEAGKWIISEIDKLGIKP
jgi:type I restriction enzyme, S subunit